MPEPLDSLIMSRIATTQRMHGIIPEPPLVLPRPADMIIRATPAPPKPKPVVVRTEPKPRPLNASCLICNARFHRRRDTHKTCSRQCYLAAVGAGLMNKPRPPYRPPLNKKKASLIVNIVCGVWNVSPAELMLTGRTHRVTVPRHAAMELMDSLLGCGRPAIGRYFGLDPSSIVHGCRNVKVWLAAEDGWPAFARRYRQAEAKARLALEKAQ